MPTPKEVIKGARRTERSVRLCLRGDLQARYEQLEREREAAEDERGKRFGGGRAAELDRDLEELRAEMAEHTLEFTFRALPKRRYTELCEQHPPRRGEDGTPLPADRGGVDISTFLPALVRECLVSPELDEEDWDNLDEALSDRQSEQLSQTAFAVNRSDVDIPF